MWKAPPTSAAWPGMADAAVHYARARGKDFAAIIPDSMRRTAPFAEALSSTDSGADVIPIRDGRPQMEQEAVALMASLLPQSQWVSSFHKSLARSGGLAETVLAWQLSKSVPAQDPQRKPFVFLPIMGVMSSVRKLGADEVKLFIVGNKAGAGHTHEDKRSFVLEFAGETLALDPGACDCANLLSFTQTIQDSDDMNHGTHGRHGEDDIPVPPSVWSVCTLW